MLTTRNFIIGILAAGVVAVGIAAFTGLKLGGGGVKPRKRTPSIPATLPGITSPMASPFTLMRATTGGRCPTMAEAAILPWTAAWS